MNSTLKFTVYALVLNGRAYVGATSMILKNRWRSGNGYSNHPEFYADILEYGWSNVEKMILAKDLTQEQAEQLEIDTIARIKPELLYNKAVGGNLLSDEARVTLSNAMRGIHNNKTNSFGKPSKPVAQIDAITNTVIKLWESTKAVERELGVSHSSVSNICNNVYGYKTAKGFTFKFVEEITVDCEVNE